MTSEWRQFKKTVLDSCLRLRGKTGRKVAQRAWGCPGGAIRLESGSKAEPVCSDISAEAKKEGQHCHDPQKGAFGPGCRGLSL